LFHRPDEISATEISSRLNRRRIYKRAHLTGQVGQAGQADFHRYAQIHLSLIGGLVDWLSGYKYGFIPYLPNKRNLPNQPVNQ